MLAACASSLVLAACGGGGEPQDADEPAGEFPVQITQADFKNRQRLAQVSDLTLGVRNTGDQAIPDLAITISTKESGDEGAEAGTTPDGATGAEGGSPPGATTSEPAESFSIPIEHEEVAIPYRPVWILEHGYPKLVGEAAPAGAFAAQTKTFSFGPLEPGETREMVWKLVPVIAGTFTVTYEISASLEGNATAVTADGSLPTGEFVVQISDVPPQTRVDERGKVVPIEEGDIIGQAGSEEQRGEVGGK